MHKLDTVVSLPPYVNLHDNLQFHQTPRTHLPYHLPTNAAIPDDLREDFVPICHITCSKRLTMPINKKDILTRANFDNAIGLLRTSLQLVGGHQSDGAI